MKYRFDQKKQSMETQIGLIERIHKENIGKTKIRGKFGRMKNKVSQKADNIQYKIEQNQLLNPNESLDVIVETKREDIRMDT